MRSTQEMWREQVQEVLGLGEGTLWMDGFDECVVGSMERFGMEPVLAYDVEKVMTVLMREGMTREEAEEWWGVNMVGAWVGERTPGFVRMVGEGVMAGRPRDRTRRKVSFT